MKILLSAFTGYNFRELLLPLVPRLNQDAAIEQVIVVTPAASHSRELFPDLGNKYIFVPEEGGETEYRRQLQQQQPDIVLTPTNGLEPRDITLLKAAQLEDIPTLTFIASWDNVYKIERRVKIKKYRSAYAIPDYFAVWNAFNRDHVLRLFPDFPAEQVVITGPPRFDYLAQGAALPSRAEVLRALNIPDDGKKLIHLATTELYSSDYLVKALAAARDKRAIDACHLFVSVHPGGNKARHAAYARPFGAAVDYSFGRRIASSVPDFLYAPTWRDLSLHAALFKHADLLINHSSTVTIESIIAGTPVINVKYGRPLDWWNWYRSMIYRDFTQHARIIVESKATQVVTSRRELIEATSRYLKDPDRDRAARQALAKTMVTFTDGSAGARLLDLIKKVAHAERSAT